MMQMQIRVLATRFAIRTNDEDLLARLDYLSPRAEQAFPVGVRSDIDVIRTGTGYRISGGGMADEYQRSLSGAFERLAARLHDAAVAALPGHVRIHAASVRHARGHVLLVGAKRAGKTTLAAHLLLDGFEVGGDELVLLEHGVGVPYPRPFYVREAALALLPKLPDACREGPFTVSPDEGRLTALDPAAIGLPWRIGPAPVAACVWLEPEHGAPSTLIACSKLDMVRRVLSQCAPPGGGRRDWIADVCATLNSAATATLRLGDLASATVALRPILR